MRKTDEARLPLPALFMLGTPKVSICIAITVKDF